MERVTKNLKKNKKQQSKKKRNLKIAGVVILVVAVLGMGGYMWWYFTSRTQTTDGKIELTIDGDEKLANGSQGKLRITAENVDRNKVTNVKVNVIYPDGFLFDKSEPESVSFGENEWELGVIESGESKDIFVDYRLIGNPNEEKKFEVKLTYYPHNFNSEFKVEDEFIVTLLESNLDINVEVPRAVTSETEFPFKVQVGSNDNLKKENVGIRIIYPDNYVYNTASEFPKKNNNIWRIAELDASGGHSLEVKGSLVGAPEEENEFKVEVGIFDKNEELFIQNTTDFVVEIIKLSSELSLTINGKTEGAVSLGEEVNMKATYKNTGTEELNNVSFELEINEDYFDIIDAGQAKLEENILVWDKSGLPELEKIEADGEGELSFKMKIKDDIELSDDEVQNILLRMKLIMKGFVGDEQEITKESDEVLVKLNTKVLPLMEAFYYDPEGRKVGSGPVPPVVGKATKYRLYMILSNTMNEVEDGKFVIKLAPGTTFTGQTTVSVGSVDYVDGSVVWNTGMIPAGVGRFLPTLEGNFEVAITPTYDQVGKKVKLIEESVFVGKDTFTGVEVREELGELDNDLPSDLEASGKGVVVRD